MNVFKKKYDYIIFDSPPVISVTDAGLLGAETDGVIMVIKANRTQKGVVDHADDLLKKANVKLLGYILTNTVIDIESRAINAFLNYKLQFIV